VVSGQWFLVFATLFPSLSSVKIFLRDEGVASTATANRKFATANPCRRGDRTRNARATLRWLEKTRRRLHGAAQIEPACFSSTAYPPPPNFTVTWFEQFPVPAWHTLYV
jgi:hypothetical protein